MNTAIAEVSTVNHPVVSRDRWIAERKALLAHERELTHLRDQIARERRALPWVRVDKDYVFDTTEGRGPAPFLVMQVVPGFRQALVRMQQGGRYKIVIPGRLAYGRNPPQGSPIGPNEDLSFDVHVLQVAPNAALSLGAAQQQGQ